MKIKQKGFTLIELLVVIAIIGLLSSIVLASLNSARAKARDARRIADLKQISTALEFYYDTNNAYPACRAFSPWNGTHWGNVIGSCLYTALVPTYIQKLSADPVNKEGGTGNYLGDNVPTDQGYVYDSNGANYVLGANLEKGGTASDLGNYQVKN
ncbi:MAG: prepilin-type N-terminal cleavage/methylation domain-containing protein [bacterium]|nr:prepilin-type N-terminal cleavage/methylation domain-containing protein [bacterium]